MKIKCYTIVSPSHRELLEKYMLPSFPNNPNMEMNIKYIPQLCPTSEFESTGWHDVMKEKALCFYENLLKLNDNEAMMYIDCDIYHVTDWYEDIVNHSHGYDLVVQNDYGGNLNSGYFYTIKNERTINLFKAIHTFINNYSNEQKALSEFCMNHRKYYELKDLKWKFFPREYWTYGENYRHFDGTDDFTLPDNLKMVHLNWTKTFALKDVLGNMILEKLK